MAELKKPLPVMIVCVVAIIALITTQTLDADVKTQSPITPSGIPQIK
jgi:hypothetical protein|tara:strand:+ start:709 stop:849 length:141 start_codon:yes stop_codon:yes gene_type:complete